MVEKVLPKILFFSILAGLFLVSCLEPVDYGALAKEVEDYIESKKGLVRVDNQTTDKLIKNIDTLVGGNRIITGLKPGYYYMVHNVLDKDDNETYEIDIPHYVTHRPDHHALHPHLGEIEITTLDVGIIKGYVDEGSIIGLINGYMYTVRDASPFEDDDKPTYSYESYTGLPTFIKDGEIVITNLRGDDFELDLSKIIEDDVYTFVAIPIGVPSGTLTTETFNNPIKQAIGTRVDYVFVNNEDCTDFKVLRVSGTTADVDMGEILIEVNHEVFVVLSDDGYKFFDLTNFNDKTPVNIEIKVEKWKDGFGNEGTSFDSIKWYCEGDEIVNDPGKTTISTDGKTLTLIFDMKAADLHHHLAIGRHVFTVEAVIGSIPYSKNFTLDIYYRK